MKEDAFLPCLHAYLQHSIGRNLFCVGKANEFLRMAFAERGVHCLADIQRVVFCEFHAGIHLKFISMHREDVRK